MAELRTKDGTVPFHIPSIETSCYTYYKVVGDLSTGTPPLVVVHGGPGAGHEYLLPFSELWSRHGIPLVFYDQIGCASSTHLPQTAGDESFWQESLFLSELNNLLDRLGIRDGPGFDLLGQSWGGNLGAAFAATHPRGLRKLILASATASKELARQGYRLLREQLPQEAREAIEAGLQNGDVESSEFKGGMQVFFKKFLCRAEPFPPVELIPCFKNMSEDPTVNKTMQGPSTFLRTGSLRDWTCIPRLPQIAVPTLVYNGEYDTSHDLCTTPFVEHIPQARRVKIANAAHMCHLESGEPKEQVLKLVGEFLTHK